MSSFGAIKDQVYTILDTMATVDGYFFNWETRKRLDTYIKESATVKSTVHYPVDTPLFTEIKEQSTNEYRMLARTIYVKSKVKSAASILRKEDMVDENNEVIDSMIDDLCKAFTSSTLNSCDLGVTEVNIIDASKEDITSKGAYYPFLLNTEFQIIYKKGHYRA